MELSLDFMVKVLLTLSVLCSISEAELSRDETKKIVYDTDTKLMWQDNEVVKPQSFYEAKKYCSDLNLGGYGNWRLPTDKEFLRLFRHNPENTFRHLVKHSDYMTSRRMFSAIYKGGVTGMLTVYSYNAKCRVCCVRKKDDR